MVEAVRKRNLFDSVELQQAENPEEVPFNEDFALVLPATRDAEWGIRVQGQDARVPTTIRLGPESQSHLQRLTTWLERIEKVARKSRQQEN